jgi:hypothetical protein
VRGLLVAWGLEGVVLVSWLVLAGGSCLW